MVVIITDKHFKVGQYGYLVTRKQLNNYIANDYITVLDDKPSPCKGLIGCSSVLVKDASGTTIALVVDDRMV